MLKYKKINFTFLFYSVVLNHVVERGLFFFILVEYDVLSLAVRLSAHFYTQLLPQCLDDYNEELVQSGRSDFGIVILFSKVNGNQNLFLGLD
jgi:hypothetical protein